MKEMTYRELLSKVLHKGISIIASLHCWSDEVSLRMKYMNSIGHKLNLSNPRTFNEKLQWLKIHDRNPLYTTLVDKYAVKEWVAERIGEEYVVPTYGVWEHFDEIDLDKLPERFVLKCTHDSGGLAICRDRKTFDVKAARRKLESSLKHNYYWNSREWPYKDVPPRIIAEEYLEPDAISGEVIDYKFMCFGGKARCVFSCTGRAKNDLRIDFFDLDWKHLPFERHYPNADEVPLPPSCLTEMAMAAERLSIDLPFVRVDFYDVDGEPRFGEMTLYPGAGFEEFTPEEWDVELGSWISLPLGGVIVNNEWIIWLHEEDGRSCLPLDLDSADSNTNRYNGLIDYKFYCFAGEPRFLYVSQGLDNHDTATISFLTLEWEFAPFQRPDYRRFNELPEKPLSLEKMLEIARVLSSDIPFVRVDLYEIDGCPMFSEMTFSPNAGFMKFEPKEWDTFIGRMLDLG